MKNNVIAREKLKAFTLNFWKCVLVALILSIVVGATSNNWGGAFPAFTNGFNNHDVVDTVDDPQDIIDDVSDDEPDFVFNIDTDDLTDEEIAGIIGAIAMIMILCFVVWIVATAIALAVKYFLLTPFEYGCRKFFRKNLDEPAKLSNLVYVFDSHYKNVVKTAFLRDLFIWLWSLLFVIPGIIMDPMIM